MFGWLVKKLGLKEVIEEVVSKEVEQKQSDFQIAKLEDDGSVYMIFVDEIDPQHFHEIAEYVENVFERHMPNSDAILLNGSVGSEGQFSLGHTTISNISPEYCPYCETNRMYDSKKEEFYCPSCDER